MSNIAKSKDSGVDCAYLFLMFFLSILSNKKWSKIVDILWKYKNFG